MAVDGPEDNGEELEAFLKEKQISLPKPTPTASSLTASTSKEDLETDEAEKDKNRVDKAWSDFNQSLQTPPSKGQTDAEAAAEAIANLFEKIFAGIAFAREGTLHPKAGFEFASKNVKKSYHEIKEDLQEKVDSIKDVEKFGKKTGNIFKDLFNYAQESKKSAALKKKSNDTVEGALETRSTKLFSVSADPSHKSRSEPEPADDSIKPRSPRPR